MPISRVRSVTETSMMFMMPMPPTISETAAMPASSRVMVLLASWAASANSVMSRTIGSSGSPSLVRLRWRSRFCTCSWAAAVF
jgi:hypothetical protein